MKTTEELNTLKEKFDTADKKLSELTEKNLAQVSGGGWTGILEYRDFYGATAICPHCRKPIFGTQFEIDAHIGACDREIEVYVP